jgi:hypothetical protein
MSQQKAKKTPVAGLIFIFFIAAIGFGGGLAWVVHQAIKGIRTQTFASIPADKKFILAWQEDLQRMDRLRTLPPGFKDLKSVEYIATTEKLKVMLKKYPMDFKTSGKGRYALEILLDELKGGGLMMQYDLVDLKSGNTVWERGRTFPQKF